MAIISGHNVFLKPGIMVLYFGSSFSHNGGNGFIFLMQEIIRRCLLRFSDMTSHDVLKCY
jgi:hypothetical protein